MSGGYEGPWPPEEPASRPASKSSYEQAKDREEEERAKSLASSRARLGSSIDLAGTLAQIRAGVREWLIEGVWIHGEYGVLAAEPKLGKTTMILDLAIAVATGGKWLGRFQAKHGKVLMFAGEGGAMSLVARVDAVARFHNVPMEVLAKNLRVVPNVPKIRSAEDMQVLAEIMSAEASTFHPDLVVIDPAYMAAGGIESSQVTAMGDELPKLQAAVVDHGASLIVVHHYNRNTAQHGAARLSGAGWREWARATLAAESLSKAEKLPDGRWQVDVRISTEGGETPGEEIIFRRNMWKGDPLDLSAPLFYEVSELDRADLAEVTSMSDSDRKVLRAVEDRAGQWLNKLVVSDGSGVSAQQVNTSLKALAAKGRVLKAVRGGNHPHVYCSAAGDMPELPDMYHLEGADDEPF